MPAPPPRNQEGNCNVRAREGSTGIFTLFVNKIHDLTEQASIMVMDVSQFDRALDGEKNVYDIANIEKGRNLKDKLLKNLLVLTMQYNSRHGNYEIVAKVKKMKELIEHCISSPAVEDKTRKFSKNSNVQSQKIIIDEIGDDNPVEQSRLIVQECIEKDGIPEVEYMHERLVLLCATEKNDARDDAKVEDDMTGVISNLCPEGNNEDYQEEVIQERNFVSPIQLHSQPAFLYHRYVDAKP